MNTQPMDTLHEAHNQILRWKRRRRSRSSIDREGAGARLKELLDQRPLLTFDEIVIQLHSEGFGLSRSAINRWYRNHYDDEEREQRRRIRPQLPSQGTTRADVLSLEEANTAFLQSQLLAYLQTKDTVDRETLDICRAVAALATAAAQRERVRMAREKGIRAAAKRIKSEIQAELKKHPDLARRLTEVASFAEERLVNANSDDVA
jgi:hypothetical protein